MVRISSPSLEVESSSHSYFLGDIAPYENVILGSEAVAGSAELGFVKEEFLEVKLECGDETENSGNIDHQTKSNRQGYPIHVIYQKYIIFN